MNRKLILILTFIFACSTLYAQNKQQLNVLFVWGSGNSLRTPNPGGRDNDDVMSRRDAYNSFLNERFTGVKMIYADDYTPQMSVDYDVTIIDTYLKGYYKGEQGELSNGDKRYFTEQRLPYDFSSPIMFIADAIDRNSRAIGCKFDWM